jgi:FkbM family methyltransferase
VKCDQRITVHHVGGRGGGGLFPTLKAFHGDFVEVLYDADADCLEQVRKNLPAGEKTTLVLPHCISNRREARTINLNFDPYTSSLLDPDPAFSSFYCYYHDHDYLFAEAGKAMERRSVETVTLDSLVESPDKSIPAPDVLSLDTQGSEYEILEGATRALQSGVVAVVLEAEFIPFYKGQKLFGQLAELLNGLGFQFCRFLSVQEWRPFRAPLGLRGDGFQSACDALFLRRVDQIPGEGQGVRVILQKLAFVSILFHQIEYAMRCLEELRRGEEASPGVEGAVPTYVRFLRDFSAAAEELPKRYPDSFAGIYTYETSKARFAAEATSWSGKAKQALKAHPLLYSMLKGTRRGLKGLSGVWRTLWGALMGSTPPERVLRRYGLRDQARLLKRNRLAQTSSARKILHPPSTASPKRAP